MASSFADLKSTWERQVSPRPRSDQIQTELAEFYAIPTQKSVDRFKDQIRTLTQRKIPLRLGEVIKTINPVIRGWGNYYCRSHVRKRFHQLDGWIIRRLWSHRTKRWRNAAWKEYPHHTDVVLPGGMTGAQAAAKARAIAPRIKVLFTNRIRAVR